MAPGPLRSDFETFFLWKHGVQKSAIFSDPSRTTIFIVLVPKMEQKSMLFWGQNQFRVKFVDFMRICRIYCPCHDFLTIFRWRNHQQNTKNRQKTDEKTERRKKHLRNSIFIVFWSILGSPGGLRKGLGCAQNPHKIALDPSRQK